MEREQAEYTVEYLDMNGILYYENVMAVDFSEAKERIRSRYPEASVRAVTLVGEADLVEADQ